MSDNRQNSTGSPPTQVPLLDVNRGNAALRDELLAAITRVCDSGRFLFGPECEAVEHAVAEVCQTRHAVACASGSDALLLALMALDVQPGDEVIVPSFTFFATASAVWRLGACPVFVDIDPHTFNIHPDLLEQAITPETRAVIPVHLFGQCAAMDVICEIAQQHSITVVEDVAQAIGAAYHGRAAGSWGAMGCLSFYPTKNLGGFGDGGMLVTNSDELADRLRLLACHGMRPRYHHREVGINSRLDSIQAAVLHVKINHLARWTSQRRENAARYDQLFAEAGITDTIATPVSSPHQSHVWNQYTIRVLHGQRDALRSWLQQRGVGSEIYYPIPLHLQECFQVLGYRPGSLPVTEAAAQQVLSLPIYPELMAQEQQYVVEQIVAFARSAKRSAA